MIVVLITPSLLKYLKAGVKYAYAIKQIDRLNCLRYNPGNFICGNIFPLSETEAEIQNREKIKFVENIKKDELVTNLLLLSLFPRASKQVLIQ